MLAHLRAFEAARQIANGRQLAGRMRAGKGDNDLVGVCVDDEVSVVRHHYDLAHLLRGDEQLDQLVEDRLRI